ncbi:MAG: MarR family transcriptional regulator [Pseudomonadota bacterium]
MSDVHEDETVKDDFNLESSLSHLLHRAQQMAANESAGKLRQAGVTLRQFSVLAAASQEDGPSQSRLVDLTGIDRSTLADMLNRMEKTGLITRATSEDDARAKSVALTDRGRDALEAAAPAVRDADNALISTLAKNRRSSFVDLLTTLIDSRTEAETPKKSDDKAEGEKSKDAKKKSKSKAKGKGKNKDKKKSKKKAKA